MAMFPRIQSPCPYKDRLASVMDGDFCRMCQRDVFDLTDMTDGERVAFLAACEGEVCVSYRLPLRPALAAAALAAASLAALPAAAQDGVVGVEFPYFDAFDDVGQEIIVGGIKDPKNTVFVEDTADAAIPELPVVYEQDAPATPAR